MPQIERGEPTTEDTRARILRVALQRFAADGYRGTSLNAIADEVGIKRPSLLYHFPSKDALYRATVLASLAGWIDLIREATTDAAQGWAQVDRVLAVAFRFFEERPELVRLARREALDGGPILGAELGEALKPVFDSAIRWLEAEMDAGRLRRHDARQLLVTSYGAVLSYFSDAPLLEAVLDLDPLAPEAVAQRRQHVVDVLRLAFEA